MPAFQVPCWYCPECKFGPLQFALYASCIECGYIRPCDEPLVERSLLECLLFEGSHYKSTVVGLPLRSAVDIQQNETAYQDCHVPLQTARVFKISSKCTHSNRLERSFEKGSSGTLKWPLRTNKAQNAEVKIRLLEEKEETCSVDFDNLHKLSTDVSQEVCSSGRTAGAFGSFRFDNTAAQPSSSPSSSMFASQGNSPTSYFSDDGSDTNELADSETNYDSSINSPEEVNINPIYTTLAPEWTSQSVDGDARHHSSFCDATYNVKECTKDRHTSNGRGGGEGNMLKSADTEQHNWNGKRAGQDEDSRGDKHEEDENSKRANKRRKSYGIGKPDEYACLFAKHNPQKCLRYCKCANSSYPSIHRLKQHLQRRHLVYQCARCHKPFSNPKDRDTHLNQRRVCDIKREERRVFAINEEKWREIGPRRVRGQRGEAQHWKWMYHVAFPEVREERIPSPFYNPEVLAGLDQYGSDEECSRRSPPSDSLVPQTDHQSRNYAQGNLDDQFEPNQGVNGSEDLPDLPDRPSQTRLDARERTPRRLSNQTLVNANAEAWQRTEAEINLDIIEADADFISLDQLDDYETLSWDPAMNLQMFDHTLDYLMGDNLESLPSSSYQAPWDQSFGLTSNQLLQFEETLRETQNSRVEDPSLLPEIDQEDVVVSRSDGLIRVKLHDVNELSGEFGEALFGPEYTFPFDDGSSESRQEEY